MKMFRDWKNTRTLEDDFIVEILANVKRFGF